ncbi:SIR2 family protein [Echinicola salinicaeni]|uniref:SIR2 family protein n=1 Tax=Echinicola salinicaeni TaxID=2762757 RepID=UPI0016456DFF|nr:SIR2 family protein [Echinicola salinicaeni]
MAIISFLLGSGFSIPEGLPSVRQLNKRMGKIHESEILIHTDEHAMFLNGQNDPNRWSRKHERLFLQEFLEFYNNEVIDNPDHFHYETFYDFYSGYLRERENNDLIEKFNIEFNSRYFKGSQPTRNCRSRIEDFNRSFNQLLGSQLHNKKYFEDVGISGHYPYNPFFRFIGDLLRDHNIKVHTLNHDLFFDWVGRHHSDLFEHFSDGFELAGSPFYGSLIHDFRNGNEIVHKSYKVKLERYTGIYDGKLSLFKLHGSIFNKIIYRNNEAVRIKSNYAISSYLEEVFNDETNKHEFQHTWDDVSPDFLSGTTEKTIRYVEDEYYVNLFNHFERNLQQSEILIVIGYGFQDPGINEYLTQHFLSKGKKMVVIDPYKPKTDLIDKYKAVYIPHGVDQISYQDYSKLNPIQ